MSYDIQIYNKLLELPLFQGMSRNDLSQIVAHTKFGFHKYAGGKYIVREGDECNQLFFLINGKIKVVSIADDHSYAFIEEMTSPHILQPECIFGLSQRYTRNFIAQTNCNFITIDKTEAMKLSDNFIIFRLNMLNIISTQLQKLGRQPWRRQPENLQQRIIRFIECHCLRPAGEKHIVIKMQRLADELNDSRLDISRALNSLQTEGLIKLRRGGIDVPSLEKCLLRQVTRNG